LTEPKRARDLQVGDVMPDGSTVTYIAPGVRAYNIRARRPDGTIRRIRYAPQTIIPGPDERHPSRFEGGHPWTRKGRSTSGNA
jgi:hypothetical protein